MAQPGANGIQIEYDTFGEAGAQPVLLIHGGAEPLVPVECGIDTARHIKGARLEIVEGMGHDLPPQQVDPLTTMIAAHAKN